MGVEGTSWQADPFGVHELRFFSADGKPTLLVMDDGKTSYDRPPAFRPASEPVDAEPESPTASRRPANGESGRSPAPQPALTLAAPSAHVEEPEVVAAPARMQADAAEGGAGTKDSVRPAVPQLGAFATSGLSADAHIAHEPIGRSLKIVYAAVLAVLVLSVLGFGFVHLRHVGDGTSAHPGVATTTSAPTRGTTSTAVTTTTVPLPSALSSSADAAATALVSSWSAGNRQTALTVATPDAVATLFAVPYSSGLAIARGCSTAFSPIVCTYGPPGGAAPSDAIYQVRVSQTTGGWYVSSVRIEG